MEKFYAEAIRLYRHTFPCSNSPLRRQIRFWDKHPELKPSRAWERTLYEMTVFEWHAYHHTGICYPLAVMAKCYAQDVLGVSGQVVGISAEEPDGLHFCHAVLELNGKYYDIFNPGGTDHIDNIHYGESYPKVVESGYVNVSAPLHHGTPLTDYYLIPLRDKVYPNLDNLSEFTRQFGGSIHLI